MANRIVLHVGTMKSGTSFLQSVLMANPEAMARQGGSYLGRTFGKQSRAVRQMFKTDRDRARFSRGWYALAEEARAYDGEVGVISMEFLSFANGRKVRELLAPYSGLDVRVVVTVRDQFRAIPAQFQTFTRNFGTDDWPSYLRRIQADSGSPESKTRAYTTFHRAQDSVPIMERWARAKGVSGLEVVTVPPSGAPRELLWERFCAAAGLDPAGFALDGLHTNESIGLASCDYLRRLNAHLADVRPAKYRSGMRPLVRGVLAPLREGEPRPELGATAAGYAGRRNQEIRVAVARLGASVTGTLEDLPIADPQPAPEPNRPPTQQVLRAARAVAEHCAAELGRAAPDLGDDLDDTVARTARLLRRMQRWGRRGQRPNRSDDKAKGRDGRRG